MDQPTTLRGWLGTNRESVSASAGLPSPDPILVCGPMRKNHCAPTLTSDPTEQPISVSMLVDKAVLYSASLAKYRAAFFRFRAPLQRVEVGHVA
jgi:hypothetical protein